MEKRRTKRGVHAAGSADARDSGANKYSQAELALMRTQDARYVGSRAAAEAGRIERLRASLHFVGATDGLGGGGSGDDDDDQDDEDDEDDGGGGGLGRRPLKRARHTVFVDSPAEAAAFSPEAFFDTPGQLLGRAHNRPRRAQLKLISGSGAGAGGGAAAGAGAPARAAAAAAAGAENGADADDDDGGRLRRAAEAAAKHERALLLAAAAAAASADPGSSGKNGARATGQRRLEKARAAAYSELAQREDRRRRLRRVEEHLALARAVCGAGGKGSGRQRKLRREQMAAGTPANVKVFKWKRERRR
jgi:U3 small nucleolar RNA-associated protein 11